MIALHGFAAVSADHLGICFYKSDRKHIRRQMGDVFTLNRLQDGYPDAGLLGHLLQADLLLNPDVLKIPAERVPRPSRPHGNCLRRCEFPAHAHGARPSVWMRCRRCRMSQGAPMTLMCERLRRSDSQATNRSSTRSRKRMSWISASTWARGLDAVSLISSTKIS